MVLRDVHGHAGPSTVDSYLRRMAEAVYATERDNMSIAVRVLRHFAETASATGWAHFSRDVHETVGTV
jgi:protoporphyrinogen oxidase